MGYLKIVTAILIWSSLGIFIRKIELPNHYIIFYASTIAGFLQFFLLISTGQFKKARHAESNSRSAVFLVLAPLCFIANALLFYFAFRNTTIANAVLTHYTAPVFVAILAPLLLKEKIQKTAWMAILFPPWAYGSFSVGKILQQGCYRKAMKALELSREPCPDLHMHY